MSYGEKCGRAYCRAIGADPDEIVKGYFVSDQPRWVSAPRWSWYQGARP